MAAGRLRAEMCVRLAQARGAEISLTVGGRQSAEEFILFKTKLNDSSKKTRSARLRVINLNQYPVNQKGVFYKT